MAKDTTFADEVYAELGDNELEQHIIYFLKLPMGNVIKIGRSTIKNLVPVRIRPAQTYFVEDIECLGIESCESGTEARNKEQQLLRRFGRARPNSELVKDDPAVRDYIEKHSDIDKDFAVAMSNAWERERNRNRRRSERNTTP